MNRGVNVKGWARGAVSSESRLKGRRGKSNHTSRTLYSYVPRPYNHPPSRKVRFSARFHFQRRERQKKRERKRRERLRVCVRACVRERERERSPTLLKESSGDPRPVKSIWRKTSYPLRRV